MTTAAIWWIRRDLRLYDNPALSLACDHASQVIPLFILSDALWESPYVGAKRLAFLLGGLRALNTDLQARGGRLIMRRGPAAQILPAVMDETGATAVFAQEDFSPFARNRDRRVAEVLAERFTLTGGTSIRPPAAVKTNAGGPYTVYTPYKKKWLAYPLPGRRDVRPIPDRIETPGEIDSLTIPDAPTLPEAVAFPPGEAEGRRRLAAFLSDGIDAYAEKRDDLAIDGTSRLSPYLRFGMLSAREAAVRALEAKAQATSDRAREGADTWLSELIWRDFYISVLFHYPHVRGGNFRPEYDGIAWENDTAAFETWCRGRTGYPLVDAAMRQLNATGWMHNRARMIVASFLVKDLLVDWRWGEKYFMQQLVDGDPAANNGGWQWSAGTGTDAAPYFRIFNPVSQSEKYASDGTYIRRWVPELRAVADAYIHTPWQMPADEQKKVGCLIGQDYAQPLVDHQAARERTLDAYKKARRKNDA